MVQKTPLYHQAPFQHVTPVSPTNTVSTREVVLRHISTGTITDHLHSDAIAAGPTAQIIVGSAENTKTFYVHKQLLCNSSTYFNVALNNGFAETRDQIVRLDDEDPDIILTFILWLYEGKLNKETLPLDQPSGMLDRYLFKLYVLSDKRGIGRLANDTITMLASFWSQSQVNLSEVAWIITLVSRNSKLYELILDNLILELRADTLHHRRLGAMDLPKEFLFDLLARTTELSESFCQSHQCFGAVCHYHCHGEQGLLSKED